MIATGHAPRLIMIEKIGKYRILERVGRGGMGTVFKAHDPILNRLVALKVISGEVEVTHELKTRFYREARACAKLNHPNIIIVYDLGEDEDRLFIVMEFLEGEDLKRLIARRTELPLEEKLSLMIQVCDGLHYAHQHGVIHRDIKPGNIFVLQNRQVKILDFGIARIAASDPGLTRTGLIMGTLRYVSPEQARGRVDHRSDVFSAGSVFYELLTYRPAFDRENPIEILEQLRTEDPAPITAVDPSIPSDLASIIERALRKDPGQRFQDLGQMRAELELIHRRLTEAAEQLRAEVRARLADVRALQAALGERLGELLDESTLPVVEDDAPLNTLRALQRDFAGRLDRLRARLEGAHLVEPMVAHGLELMRRGEAAGAIAAFERALREMPDHPRALAGLRTARAEAEARRPRQIPEIARPAESSVAPAARDVSVASGGVTEATAPRSERSTAGRPGRAASAARRFGVREGTIAAVLLAAVAGGVTWVWRSPSTPVPATPSAPAPRGPPVAGPTPGQTPAPATASGPTPQAPIPVPAERAAAEEGRTAMIAARDAAAKVNAEPLLPSLWAPAAETARDADAAFDQQEFARAEAGYRDARQAYERAAAAAREAIAMRQVEEQAAEARRAAEIADASTLAPSLWARAVGAQRQADEAAQRQERDTAQALYQDAATAYRDAERDAARKAAADSAAERERAPALRRELQAAERAAAAAATARKEAEQAGAPRYAPKGLALAQEKEKEGQAALGRQDYAAAQRRFRQAQQEYQRTRQEAAEADKRNAAAQAQLQRDAEQAGTQMTQMRGVAEQADAKRLAPKLWAAGTAKETDAQAALARKDYAVAEQRFREAQQEYQRATQEAQREAVTLAQRQREAEQLRDQTAQARGVAERADAKRLVPKLWADGTAKEAEAQGALGRGELVVALQRFREARQHYQRAALDAQQAADAEKRQAAVPAQGPREADQPAQPGPAGSAISGPAEGRSRGLGDRLFGAMKKAFGRSLQGVSGPVAWEVVGVRIETDPDRQEVRWYYTLVLKETGGTAIQFERAVHSTGRGVEIWARVTEEQFQRRLEANSELRLSRWDGLTYGTGPGAEASSLREGLSIWRRFYGKDDQGKEVVIDVQFRL